MMKFWAWSGRRCFLVLAAMAAVAGFTGCSTVPYSDRSQLMFYNEEDDISAGNQAWTEILAAEPADDNSLYAPTMNRVGERIAAVAERPNFMWEFKVIPSKQVNAFALPGGKLAFYEPIFPYFANDAELATVMGHEVAHALARHGMEGQSRSLIQVLGALPFYLLLDNQSDIDSAVGSYMALTNVGAMLPYSRMQEYEADYIGLILMAKAGYNPEAAIPFWEKFSGDDTSSYADSLFSTHPRGKERIEELQRRLPEAMLYYMAAPEQYGLGEAMPKP